MGRSSRGLSPSLTDSSKTRVCGSKPSMIHSASDQEQRAEEREPVQADAGRQADRQRAQHDDGVFGVVDLRSVANQVGRADDAERARQAGADDQHDERADDRQHDLRLHDRRLPRRRAAPARPQRQRRPEGRRKRQPDHHRPDLVDQLLAWCTGGCQTDRRRRPAGCLDAGRLCRLAAAAGRAAAGTRSAHDAASTIASSSRWPPCLLRIRHARLKLTM